MGELIINLIRDLAWLGAIVFLGFEILTHSNIQDFTLKASTQEGIEISASFDQSSH